MLTFREMKNCEGYYYNTKTGEILRNVGPGETRCWRGEEWQKSVGEDEPDPPRFELLTPDVLTSFASVKRLVAERYGEPQAVQLINRQTAVQPDGELLTEEAESRLR